MGMLQTYPALLRAKNQYVVIVYALLLMRNSGLHLRKSIGIRKAKVVFYKDAI